MRTYFIHDGQSQYGPYTIEEIKKQKLSRTTLVWFEGLAEWASLEDIPELAILLTTPPPIYNGQASASIPPPIDTPPVNYSNSYVESQKPERSFYVPIIVTGGLAFVILFCWLMYSSNTQAAALENLQQQQTQAQIEESQQRLEQQKRDEEQRQRKDEAKRINDALTQRNMEYRNNWFKYIDVKTNNYRYSDLGGIYDLEIIVTNSTACMLDEVIAYVNYTKTNGGTWKTIEVPITNVPANSYKSVAVADVERGTSAQVFVKSIVSKKMHFYYQEGYSSGNSDDPFFYK